MKRHTIPALAVAALLALATGCGSDPEPAPESLGSSEVDRSSAEATAVAFANMYATGDVPAACDLANADGKEQLGNMCDGKQSWSTTVTLTGDCEKAVGAAGSRTFFFDAPDGSINRNSRLEVDVEQTESMWWVTAAITPASSGSAGSPCKSETSSPSVTAPSATGG